MRGAFSPNEVSMDTDNEKALMLLETLAECNKEITELALRLQGKEAILQVLHGFGCQRYGNEVILEGYVDIELKNRKSVCWWLEAQWQGNSWHISTQILINDSKGQFTAHDFGDRSSNELKDFLTRLLEATREMVRFDALSLKEVW